MKKNNVARKLYTLSVKAKTKRIILFLVIFMITAATVTTAVVPKKYDLQVGEIAPSDIKATRDTVDETASEEKVKEALSKVDKQFTLKTEVESQAKTNIKGLFEKIQSLKASSLDKSQKIESIKNYQDFKLDSKDAETLLNLSDGDIVNILNNISVVLNKAYEKNIVEKDEESLQTAQKNAKNAIGELGFNEDISSILDNIFLKQIQPNMFYDKDKTEELKNEVEKNTEKVIIKKNQIVVKEGEPVTESQLKVLKELGVLNENSSKGLNIVFLSVVILVAVVLFIQNYYIYRNYNYIYKDFKKLFLINFLNCIAVLVARIISIGTAYIIPFAFTPMLLTLLINSQISLFTSVINILLIGITVQFDSLILIISLINAVVGATVLRKVQQRSDIMYASLYVMVVVGIIQFSTGVILSSDIKDTAINTLYSLAGALISGILAIGLLPFLEGMFNIVTTFKLLELSNSNNPLLKKLLMEAPGTYHHSMLVANIAEMAAEEVNADSVVTRVGAYYHDIGKTERPYFFKENQLSNENPHDKISPSLSASIIIAHVKDGLKLAKEYKLPKVIQDMIAQHHGTTLVKYFYYTLKNNSENPDEIKEEDFRYSGPRPSSKEAGILMLADSVEAAVRSINEPTKEKIEQMVNNIIKDKLDAGQLDNCDLTLKDLGKIRICFLKALNGIYHQRIEYPEEKIN